MDSTALSPPPLGAKVTYVDRLPPGKAHPDVETKVHDLVIDDAERLSHFDYLSLDFIIANHVVEHCHDPIATLKKWKSKLVHGGIVYAAVPDKTQTFDAPRAVTTLQHLIDDHELGCLRSDGNRLHYEEWHRVIDKMSGKELEDRVRLDLLEVANIHFHVWDEAAQREFLAYIEKKGILKTLEVIRNGAEIIWILRQE